MSSTDSTPSAISSAAARPPSGLPDRWYFTPGPTQLHPLVPAALARAVADGLPSISHRSARFQEEVARTREALTALLDIPDGHRIFYLGSATEAMERIIQGAVARESFHLLNGAFARRFRKVSVSLGREVGGTEVEDGDGFRLEEVEIPEGPELVALTLNETSTGVVLDPPGVHDLADRHPEVLIAVDAVSAAPAVPLDLERVDAFFFSVQKLFGLPAGLGVLIASPRLVERSRELQGRGLPIGGYLHLPALADKAERDQTVATPNALAIHLLGRVAEAFLERGVDALRGESEDNAGRIVEAAGSGGWEPFVPREHRSPTVLVFQVPGGSEAPRRRLAERGLVVGDGYGPRKGKQARIANFPALSGEAVDALVDALREP